jgi:hypothetical protein
MNLAIIFLHHNTDDVTLDHLDRIKQFNPDIPVYTVGFSAHTLIEGSHIVDKSQDWMPKNTTLYSKVNLPNVDADYLIFDFIDKNPQLEHEKYLVFEWDTFFNTNVQNFYGDALNLDFFCSYIFLGRHIESWWWYQFFTDDQKAMPQLAGLTPTSGLLFSKNLLVQMLAELKNNVATYDNFDSETRLASLIRACGQELLLPFEGVCEFIHPPLGPHFNHILGEAIYHPVKNPILPLIFNQNNLLGQGVEIGVHLGDHALKILHEYQGNLHLIDPWKNLPDDEYDDRINAGDRDADYLECRNKLSIFLDRTTYYKQRSLEAVNSFEDESLDFVFIDANHKYEYVKADLEAWYPKVRQGGIIAGDDYIKINFNDLDLLEPNGKDYVVRNGHGEKLSTFGVNSALKEFCEEKSISFKKGESWFAQWYFVKP